MFRQHRSYILCIMTAAAGLALLWLGLSCGGDGGSGPDQDDSMPPATVTDLSVASAGCDSVTLAWTAPGDDWMEGKASFYDVRYSTQVMTTSNWSAATQCQGEPSPKTAGQTEHFTISGLTFGATYYFAVATGDDAGNGSDLSNNASTTVGSSTIAWVNDGLGDDQDWWGSASSVSANWAQAACADDYEYAVGTTAGGTDVVGWTSVGTQTSVTRSGLALADAETYYFSARAVLNLVPGTPASSDGFTVDVTAPTSEVQYLGEYTAVPEFTVSWHGADDGSGLKYYDIQVSSDGGSSWEDWFTATVFYAYPFPGQNGHTYHFRSRAHDNAGNVEAYPDVPDAHTTVVLSTGIAWVYDGLGSDETWTTSANTLSANWAAAGYTDSYDYAIGTTQGGTDLVGWTPAGNQTSVTRAGLALVDGATYYFSVRSVYGSEPATPTSSDGITVDITAPVSQVYALPDEVPTEIFTITWGGSDGTSGVKNYDIQLSLNGGSTWTDWIPGTTLTSASYPGSGDATYHFRSRARDNAGNVEAYPVTSDAHTTVNRAANLQVAYVNDGTGDDADWTNSQDMLYVNWPGVSGAETYEYCIGYSPGAADYRPWVSVGAATSVSYGPYYLSEGETFYASVRAVVGAGRGPVVSSDGVTTDRVAPSSRVDSMEAAVPALIFLVQWAGSDTASGVSHYNIQYRDGASNWYDWLTATGEPGGYFYGEIDHTYYFRSQAVDSAGNVEAYPPQSDARTCVTCTFAYERTWGQDGTGAGDFRLPFNVAVDDLGNVYVAESDNARVQVFDAPGNLLRQIGSYGSADSLLLQAAGVAIDDSGYVYVTDFNADRVRKYTSEGAFVTVWGEHGSGEDQMIYPRGIAVDDSFYVYVAEQGNDRVHKFTSGGVSVKTWGGYGTSEGQFSGCMGVAVSPSGDIYAVDAGNSRVQQFTSDGVFVSAWGSSGSADGQFNGINFIAIDESGHVYVTQGGDCRIQRFTPDGTFLNKWGGCGSGDGQLIDEPFGIAVHSDGTVYVTDLGPCRVVKFVRTCP